MSGNDCWNRVCFSCCWKADNELADVTLSGSLFQNRVATGNARPPTVDSLNGGICRRFDPAERSASHVFPFASPIIQPSVFWPGLLLGLLPPDTRTTWHALMVSCRVVTTWSQKLVTWAAYASAGCVIQSQITADSFVHVLQTYTDQPCLSATADHEPQSRHMSTNDMCKCSAIDAFNWPQNHSTALAQSSC